MKATLDKADMRSVSFLLEASRFYRDTCPELSRFLMQRPQEANVSVIMSHCRKCQLKKQRCHIYHSGEHPVCQYCAQWLEPGNHRVRLRPKRRASARVQSVLRREARGKRLSLTQKDMLRRFRTSRSTRMATCHGCNNTSRYNGMNREFTSPFSRNQGGTPGGGGGSVGRRQKTPQQTTGSKVTSTTTSTSSSSTPKSLGKDNKTPTRTPRASTSSSSSTPASASSSSSSSKVKKWVVQRLSKILVREDDQGRKKGSLKDFLCSL